MRIRLSLLMFITALFFSFLIATFDHYIHQEEIVKNYEEKIEFIEGTIIESLQTVDKAHSVFGCSTDRKLKESTEYIMDLYKQNPNLDEWDFEQLHNELDVDIYIINKKNKITHTSFERDLGLDFKECCGTLSKILDERRKTGELYIDHMDVEQTTGETKKYSYQATEDKKYIIQLSIPLEESRVFKYFSFFPTIEKLIDKYSMVEGINVLNIGGLAIGQVDSSFDMSPIRYNAFLQARDFAKTKEVRETYEGKELVFRYVYYEPVEETQGGDSRVLEIIYNEDELNKALSNNTKRLLYQLLVVVIIIVITILGIQKWISRQIYYARHDNLTGLKNRRAFDEFLINEIKKDKGLTALIIIDLDNFKSVNDTHGHLRGDGLLQLIATTLKETIDKPHEAFRIGGDEFAIILCEADEGFIKKMVQKIDQALTQAIEGEEDLQGLNVRASIGVSIAPIDGIYLETLYEKADIAMYDAKEKDEKKYQRYDEFLHFR